MKFCLSILLVCVAAANAAPASSPEYYLGLNDLIDRILEELGPTIKSNGLEPMPLPDTGYSFSKEQCIFQQCLTVSGEAKIFDGTVVGLSNIKRNGDIDWKFEDNKLKVTARASIKDIVGHTKAHALFQSFGPKLTAKMSLSQIDVQLELTRAALIAGDMDVSSFVVENYHGLSVEVDGLGPLDWILGGLATKISGWFKGSIIDKINTVVKKLLAENIKGLDIPLPPGY